MVGKIGDVDNLATLWRVIDKSLKTHNITIDIDIVTKKK